MKIAPLVVVVALVAVVALAWSYLIGGVDRRLDAMLDTGADYAGLDIELAPLPKSEDRTVGCHGNSTKKYGKRAMATVPDLDHVEAASRAADRFEAEGWSVLRAIPPADGGVKGTWDVEAIRDDEMIIVTFTEAGGFAAIARIKECPEFGDDFGRLVVDAFPTDG